MRLLWLADVLRAAGLTVYEVAGWRTRGDDSYGPVKGVIIHETRGSATSSDTGEINVLVNGRVGLSGPIAQLYLSRTGAWHVVASGTCHHVKTGWGGPFNGVGNDGLLGIEAQHGEAEDWARKPVQYQSYVRGVAAILRHTGWPAPVGHKEHQPGDKPDPEFSMATFRAQVAAGATTGDDDMSENANRYIDAIANMNEGVVLFTDGTGTRDPKQFGVPIVTTIRGLAAKVDDLAAKVGVPVDGEVLEAEPIDLDALADKVAARLGDSIADLVADKLAARLAS